MELPQRRPESQMPSIALRPASSTIPNPVEGFRPYASFVSRTQTLDEFVELTSISYELSQQLLFSTSRDQLSDVVIKIPKPTKWSYSMADANIGPLKMLAGLLRYSD